MKPRSSFTSSIEFFVDEAADVLLAYENSSVGSTEDESSTEVLNLSLDKVREREPAEFERTLGRLVLSFLNSRSTKDLRLPRDAAYEEQANDEHLATLQRMASAQGPEAIYDLAVALIGRGMRSKKWSAIEEGEAHLQRAIALGWPAAKQYQDEVWSLLRPRLEQKLRPSA